MRLIFRLGAACLLLALSLVGYACKPDNRAPVWEGARILPDDPNREVALRVSTDGLYDPDGDELSIVVDWWVNQRRVARSITLEPAFFARGDIVRARVRASDGRAWSTRHETPEVVIRNTPPQIRSASIGSASAIHGFSQLEAEAEVLDLDGDPVSILWMWFVDGALLSQSGDVITLPGVAAGSQLSALGIPYDDTSRGTAFRTPEVRVGIVPSEIASVRIEPEQPLHRDDLRCVVVSPAIEQPDVLSLEWEVEAPASGAAQSPVAPSAEEVSWKLTTAGEHWTCTALWPGGLALESRVTIELGPPGGNILLVLIDDVGVDNIGVYGEHPDPPPTPTIDALAAEGVLFRNAHAYPTCSPARAALLTGRYGHRNGVGRNMTKANYLATEEIGVAEVLDYSSAYEYSNSIVGKWHLAGPDSPDWLMHPAAFGFDWFAVTMLNLSSSAYVDKNLSYRRWWKNTNGSERIERTYATTDQVNDAISRIEVMPEPWFLFLSFSAPHKPIHSPPQRLHSYDLSGSQGRVKYDAMMEAADTELGRLLESIDPEVLADTTIIVMGDNGTPRYAVTSPFSTSEAKGTLHDGGTRVPLVVSGPLVQEPGSEVSALIHIVDIFPTIAEIAGVNLEELFASEQSPGSLADWPIDGESLVPFLIDPDLLGREVIYTEKFSPNGIERPRTSGSQSVRDEQWRYIRNMITGSERLFDLTTNYPNAGANLLDLPLSVEAAHAWEQLSLDLDQVIAELGE